MKRQPQLQAVKDISTLPLRYWTINKMPLVGMYTTEYYNKTARDAENPFGNVE